MSPGRTGAGGGRAGTGHSKQINGTGRENTRSLLRACAQVKSLFFPMGLSCLRLAFILRVCSVVLFPLAFQPKPSTSLCSRPRDPSLTAYWQGLSFRLVVTWSSDSDSAQPLPGLACWGSGLSLAVT